MILRYNNYNPEVFSEGFFEEIDRWKTHNQNHTISKFKSTRITDAEYEHLKTQIDIMHESEDYEEYRKAFGKFCYFCHIMPRGVIIRKHSLKKGKPDHHTLYVEYAYNTKKMTLPEGTKLYHMSKVGGIQALNPVFRGKSVKGYLYDKPRVYFTIRKHMPKFLADYKASEKLHMYICKEDIKAAYVDPLVWSSLQGAIYVETNKPIAVEELTGNVLTRFLSKEKEEQPVEESFDFDAMLDFISESGLIIEDIE